MTYPMRTTGRKCRAAVRVSLRGFGRTAALLSALTALLSLSALAQPAPEDKASRATRTQTPPILDGSLEDPVWARAEAIEDLHQYDPLDHAPPSERTAISLLYDDDYLYIGARMYDSDPSAIIARQMIVGQTMRSDDSLVVHLYPFNNRRSGYVFQVNPNGNRTDGIFETATDINRDWDGIWYAEARIDDQGWTAELAIPFKSLNFDPNDGRWGFNVERRIARKQERIAWVSYNRDVDPGVSGLVSGLSGLQQGKGLDIVPSFVSIESKNHATGDVSVNSEPALDVFYNVTPSLTGVLTFNTDFSATEVDDRQINLSRFSLFYPEKRDFFLQDVDIFSFGGLSRNGIPFFSRRIGLSPDGEQVGLDVGAKLTGRAGRWNIGVLDVRQGRFQNVDPSNLFVGRVAANVLDESSVGLIVTDGDPGSNLGNSVAGADFRYRNTRLPGGRALGGEAWYQRSDSEGLPGDDAAWGVRLASPNNEGLNAEIGYTSIQSNFNPALGFVNRRGINRTEVGVGYTFRPRHKWVRSVETGASFESYDKISGGLESRSLFVELFELETNSGDEYGLQLNRDREVLYEAFEISDGVVIPPGDYQFGRLGVELSGASERRFAPSVEVDQGEFFDGDITAIEAGFDWRPNRHFFLSLAYEYNDISLPAGDFIARLVQLEANYAFNVKWSWVNLLQYDNESKSVGVNSRLRWNPRAGQDLYLVLTQGFAAQGVFSGLDLRQSQIALKYSRTFRF
jgi:hypothetical protein